MKVEKCGLKIDSAFPELLVSEQGKVHVHHVKVGTCAEVVSKIVAENVKNYSSIVCR